MRTTQILKLSKVLTINKNSTNIIFIDHYALSMEDASKLVNEVKKHTNTDFGCIVLTRGNPNDAVKLISAKDLKEIE